MVAGSPQDRPVLVDGTVLNEFNDRPAIDGLTKTINKFKWQDRLQENV
jgi:hypothetical protein